ncbi:MAG: bifunctional chorismate mutase/prephenate dehydrogenase [Myxococcales bacterium]|nr:bifunctional chorismate mutase/prephenate dehydrogenase [Myxococcales bacterium]
MAFQKDGNSNAAAEASGSDSAPPRALPVLRALLDAIDRDVLQLLSRRMGVVGEIAAFKRQAGRKIRDLTRERRVLDARAARARRLGLPEEVVRSIWRLMLTASRDHQAQLRAEVPVKMPRRSVAIIGGHGRMGQAMARLFEDLGHAVLIADVDTELTPVEAAASADVVMISVPIAVTADVIAEIGPHVRPEALLLDVTSIKEAPLAGMLRATEDSGADVVGCHPMYGPDVHTFQGQRIVLCPGRGTEGLAWLRQAFEARGLVVSELPAVEHDQIMAVVQVLNHYRTQVLGLALARLGVPLERTLALSSPAYLLEAIVTGRHFSQSPALYGPIEMSNPRTGEVTAAFQQAAADLAAVLQAKDQPGFEDLFGEVQTYLGDFTSDAQEKSRFLIDRLVELTAGRN